MHLREFSSCDKKSSKRFSGKNRQIAKLYPVMLTEQIQYIKFQYKLTLNLFTLNQKKAPTSEILRNIILVSKTYYKRYLNKVEGRSKNRSK